MARKLDGVTAFTFTCAPELKAQATTAIQAVGKAGVKVVRVPGVLEAGPTPQRICKPFTVVPEPLVTGRAEFVS